MSDSDIAIVKLFNQDIFENVNWILKWRRGIQVFYPFNPRHPHRGQTAHFPRETLQIFC